MIPIVDLTFYFDTQYIYTKHGVSCGSEIWVYVNTRDGSQMEKKEKKNGIWLSPMMKTFLPTKIQQPIENKKTPPKTLQNDCGPTYNGQLE